MEFNYYSLVIYPNIKGEVINAFRKKYDYFSEVMSYHITLIFPLRIPADISHDDLLEHIQKITDSWFAFDIEIKGLELAWDNWLFMLIQNGNDKIIKLHDELYTGELYRFLRQDIEFIPHVAIGSFTKEGMNYDLRNPQRLELDKEKYERAYEEAKTIDIGYSCKVDKLSLVKFDSELKNCELIKEFLLK